ncbi:hypothetical protein VTN96DRAFT_9640 [Rasamsonia emersonii]
MGKSATHASIEQQRIGCQACRHAAEQPRPRAGQPSAGLGARALPAANQRARPAKAPSRLARSPQTPERSEFDLEHRILILGDERAVESRVTGVGPDGTFPFADEK